MKEIIELIKKKKQLFSQAPFFEFLRNKSINPYDRLSFAPCAAPFIMGFGELNQNVLRQEPTNDYLQKIVNQHTYEDDNHWIWFLEDLAKLDLDKSSKFSDTLRLIWSENTRAAHRLLQSLNQYALHASPIQKLLIIEIVEATGNVFLATSSQVIHELKETSSQEYRYFGSHHLSIDSGHTYCSSSSQEVVENIILEENIKQDFMEIIEHLFSLFRDFTDELLLYAQKNFKNQFVSSNSIETEFDYIIIGAGPAGLQLGYFLEKMGRKYIILEAGNAPGTFFKKYPRHQKLISINKRYTGYEDPEINLRWDWNSLLSDNPEMLFTHYSKDYFPATSDLVRYLGDFAIQNELNIKYNFTVAKVVKDVDFSIADSMGNTLQAKRLIIATGLSKAYIPNISGIEFAENYTDVSVDPEDFANQKVLIIGKGNSGFETADNLVSTAALINIVSPSPVSLAWKTKYVGHLRAVNNNLVDTYQLKSQNVILDAFVEKIEKRDGQIVVSFNYAHANGELEELVYDRVIVCTGFRFDTDIFDTSCQPELTINDRFPKQTSAWESTNIKDLYFAGTLTHMRDFKKKQSGFIHGFRYNIRALYRILEHKYHQQELPFQYIEKTPDVLTNAILNRMNVTSALWQQTGFLCDLIIVSKDNDPVRYYQDIPVDYVHDSDLGQNEHYYIVTLEFGLDIIFASPDPLAVERVHKDDIDNAAQSSGIHPIVRHFCRDVLVAEHHVIEDIASEWKEDIHSNPLMKFLQDQFFGKTKLLGIHLLEAGLINLEQLDMALNEQKATAVRLGEILSSHGWVSQQTIEYVMDKVVHKKLSSRGLRLGGYLMEAGLVNSEQIESALHEQKTTALCLGEILSRHDWVSQHTVEYLMENVVLPERQTVMVP